MGNQFFFGLRFLMKVYFKIYVKLMSGIPVKQREDGTISTEIVYENGEEISRKVYDQQGQVKKE